MRIIAFFTYSFRSQLLCLPVSLDANMGLGICHGRLDVSILQRYET